jgi:hypothetical protein
MKSLRPYILERGWALGLAGLLGLIVHGSLPSPPERTLDDLAQMLGQSAGGVVDPKQIAWEPSRGFLPETFLGRRVLFLAAPEPGKPRDLYRARVTVTLGGQPVAVTQLRNITQTPLGDEAALDISDHTAVFATIAFGRIQGVTVLDVDGIRSNDKTGSLFDRALLAVTSFQQTGSFAGLGRTDITLDVPAKAVKLSLALPKLHIDLGEKSRELHYDVATRALRGPEGAQAYAARAIPQVHLSKPLILWGVDTVREEIGPAPIAWLENRVFGARDTVRRTAYALFSSSADSALKQKQPEVVAASVLGASKLSDENSGWPPPPVPSLWQNPKPGEGQWQPVTYPFLKTPPGTVAAPGTKPASYFYSTYIRPDAKRPYAEVMLIAMDMRQLELGMEAGYEDPKPLTGAPAGGRLPQEEAVLDRVVATFNGAFKTTHGEYGMMVDRRVLLPPVAGAATVIVTESGEVGMGSWAKNAKIPDDVVAFRQNLDPLLEDGVVNPAGRNIWGWQLEGTSVMTQRTALCMTSAGHVYYAFAEEIDGPTLAKAMRQAGCSYAMHLDMNPNHCGFVFADIVDTKKNEFNLRVAHPEMKIRPDKYMRWSPKDFFYVMVRDPVPRDGAGLRWTADGAQQPPPAWLPGIFKATLSVGTQPIELLGFDKGRVDFRVRAGTLEPSVVDAPPKQLELSSDDAHRVMAAIGLGHTTDATRYGLSFGSRPSLELRGAYATLVVSKTRGPELHAPGQQPALAADEEAAQLPLLAEDGQLTPRARERGAMRQRAGLCITPAGRLVIAQTRHDSNDALTGALVRVGCKRVAELDRGSHHPAFVHRTGSSTPPVAGYETSVLYAIGRPMLPHAFRWKSAATPAAPAPPPVRTAKAP